MDLDFDNPEQLCLQGSLLLADPSLRDPGFSRSVLLLTHHSASEGAMGVILNKPVGKKVGNLLVSEEGTSLGEVEVYLGGPVSQEQLTFSSLVWNSDGSGLNFSSNLSADQARHRIEEGFDVRAFVGYSGWSEGQLESELQQRAWITTKPGEIILDATKCDDMWHAILSGMGPLLRPAGERAG